MGVSLTDVALLVALMQGVSCQDFNIRLPKSIVGITGSCVTITCNFKIPDQYETELSVNCSNGAIWRRDKYYGPIVFSERDPRLNKIQGSVVGDLRQKNCTTVFHSLQLNHRGTYFFRLECLGPPKYNFNKGVNISVLADAPPPMFAPVKPVSVGDLVVLQCSVPMPCSAANPSLTWIPRNSSWLERTQESQVDGQTVFTSTLTFFASAEHHNESIACFVTFPLTGGGSTASSAVTQRLNILYAPRSTVVTVSPAGPVSEGSTVALICSSDSNPPVSLYTWYKDDNRQLIKKAEGDTLILQVQHDTGLYLCEAQSVIGSQKSNAFSLQVDVETGINLSVSVASNIVFGLVSVLFIVIAVVLVYKYKSLSNRVKQIELKESSTYTDLRTNSVTSDYEQIQTQKPKVKPSPDFSLYQNMQEIQTSTATAELKD